MHAVTQASSSIEKLIEPPGSASMIWKTKLIKNEVNSALSIIIYISYD